MTTLIEFLGIGGFILGILNLLLLWIKHAKDKPIIRIKKKLYLDHKIGEELSDKEYAQKAERGELNNIERFRVKELILDISNSGYRDANLKNIFAYYKQKDKTNYAPGVRGFHPITISAGDRDEVHLFFEFPVEIIKDIEKTLPNEIVIEFDFAHKKIKKRFFIGKK